MLNYNINKVRNFDTFKNVIEFLWFSGKLANASGGVVNIYTGEMYEVDYVEIRMIVRKDNRVAEDYLVLFITMGNPPRINLK